ADARAGTGPPAGTLRCTGPGASCARLSHPVDPPRLRGRVALKGARRAGRPAARRPHYLTIFRLGRPLGLSGGPPGGGSSGGGGGRSWLPVVLVSSGGGEGGSSVNTMPCPVSRA